MLTLATVLLAAGPVASAAVPAEVDRHYREYNVVTAFSTTSERQTIAAGAAAADARLGRIARLMDRLARRVTDFDPGMVRGRRPGDELSYRSDVVRVTSWVESGDRATATLDVAALDRGSNVTLVAQFDTLAGGDDVPSIDEILTALGDRPRIHTTEVHRWVRVGGAWRREAATLHLLAY
jgi:hypothetical protein